MNRLSSYNLWWLLFAGYARNFEVSNPNIYVKFESGIRFAAMKTKI